MPATAYWVEPVAARIVTISKASPVLPALFPATLGPRVTRVAVDGSHVYWNSLSGNVELGAIRRAQKNGSQMEVLGSMIGDGPRTIASRSNDRRGWESKAGSSWPPGAAGSRG